MTGVRTVAAGEWRALVAAARAARAKAYAPYSRFAVGAALLGEDGSIHAGCNVENASYGLTVCAERAAVLAAVAAGVRRFRALALAAGTTEPAPPCGACRQVLAEFCRDLPIRMVSASGRVRTRRLRSLLPMGFVPRDMRR